jgi:hypothetical protein
LGDKIDKDLLVISLQCRFGEQVGALEILELHVFRESLVKANERAVRAIRIRALEGNVAADAILGEHPRHHGFPYTTPLPTDQMHLVQRRERY